MSRCTVVIGALDDQGTRYATRCTREAGHESPHYAAPRTRDESGQMHPRTLAGALAVSVALWGVAFLACLAALHVTGGIQ